MTVYLSAFAGAGAQFFDDNGNVLDAAARFGIRHLYTVSQPDSARPHRDGLAYPAFNDFAELLPHG